jgi:hypothetical protein
MAPSFFLRSSRDFTRIAAAALCHLHVTPRPSPSSSVPLTRCFPPPLPCPPRSNFGTDSMGTGASQARLAIAFTCGVCSTRNHKMFSRRSYERGVVIIRCDGTCRSAAVNRTSASATNVCLQAAEKIT